MKVIVYTLIGRILIWALSTTPLFDDVRGGHPKIQELLNCDFCLGFWVYSFLAVVFDLHLDEKRQVRMYPLIGLLTSFVMHLFTIGWKEKFDANG